MRGFEGSSKSKEETEKERFGFTVAISPTEVFYDCYDEIPHIPRPRFLMVKEETIIADGWLIRIAPYRSFLDFVSKISAEWWNLPDEATKRQLTAFIEAIESEIFKSPDSGEEDGLPS